MVQTLNKLTEKQVELDKLKKKIKDEELERKN